MTPWILGFPLVVLALVVAALVWLDHRERIAAFFDEVGERIRETLESMGRLPFVILLALILLPPSPAQAGIRIDIPQLVEAILVSTVNPKEVMPSEPVDAARTTDRNNSGPSADVGGSSAANGQAERAANFPAPATAHPTPVAGMQEDPGPPPQPPAPAPTNEQIVRAVFHEEPDKAVDIFTCESGLRTTAKNGQHLGIAQMGQEERERFGHAEDAQTQVEAAKDYYDVAQGFGPWKACW